jgi:hypothetical protein
MAKEELNACYLWEVRWAKAMPDPIVAKAIGKGIVDVACLPEERRRRLEEKGLIRVEEKEEEEEGERA